jgi:predicted dehydrogenase
MSALRGAIVGCGYFSRFHLEAWTRVAGAEIAAACDPVRERAQAAATRAYTEAERLFAAERLDFVDLATPPETHLPLLRLAIAARVPAVLMQKPLAPSWEEALEIARVAAEAGIRLMIHENWR